MDTWHLLINTSHIAILKRQNCIILNIITLPVCFQPFCFSGTYLVRRHRVASWLPHSGLRHSTQRRPSKSAVPFVKPACGTDRVSLNKSTLKCHNKTLRLYRHMLLQGYYVILRESAYAALQSGSVVSVFPSVMHWTHLSAFVSGDVFLQRHHVGDGLDGHEVNTWQEETLFNKKKKKTFLTASQLFQINKWDLPKQLNLKV